MHDQTLGELERAFRIFPALDQDTLRRTAVGLGPERIDHGVADLSVDRGEQLAQAVGAVDHGEAAATLQHQQAALQPAGKIQLALDMSIRALADRRGGRSVRAMEGRVSHDVIEARRHQPRRQLGEVAGDHLGSLSKAVRLDIGVGDAQEIPLQLDADQTAGGHARCKAEHGSTATRSHIQDLLTRLRRHGCCEKDRVDSHPIAALGLKKSEAAAEQCILA